MCRNVTYLKILNRTSICGDETSEKAIKFAYCTAGLYKGSQHFDDSDNPVADFMSCHQTAHEISNN